MADSAESRPSRYLWPWCVLGAVLLAAVPAAFWMKKEIGRARLLREHPITDVHTETNRAAGSNAPIVR